MEILEVTLMTDQLKETEEFYREKLGLILIKRNKTSISFTVGRTLLKFIKSNHLHPVYHFAFNIPNNQFKEAVTWASLKFQLINTDDNNVIADFTNWNAKAFYFFDNNGNILEFIARYDLETDNGNHFSGASLLCVSEVGFITENIASTTEKFKSLYSLHPYEKQPLKENFAALGDANGLIILSTNGRHWFPTEIPAHSFPCQIRILVNGKMVDITTDSF